MDTFLIDFKNDVYFYSTLIKAEDEDDAYFKALHFIKPNYKIDCVLNLGSPPKKKCRKIV